MTKSQRRKILLRNLAKARKAAQTPEAIAKRVEATRQTKARRTQQIRKTSRGPRQAEIPDFKVAYAFGHVQAWLDIYARSSGISPSTLADQVGKLLRG